MNEINFIPTQPLGTDPLIYSVAAKIRIQYPTSIMSKPMEGTCFFIYSPNGNLFIITAAHLFKNGAISYEIEWSDFNKNRPGEFKSHSEPVPGNENIFKPISSNFDCDFVVIKTDKVIFENRFGVNILENIVAKDDTIISPANNLIVVGFPLGEASSKFHWGIVRTARIATPFNKIIYPSKSTNKLHLPGFAIDGYFQEGMSGSPVILIDHFVTIGKGKVDEFRHASTPEKTEKLLLGMYVGPYDPDHNQKTIYEQETGNPSRINLGLVIRASIIYDFIKIVETRTSHKQ